MGLEARCAISGARCDGMPMRTAIGTQRKLVSAELMMETAQEQLERLISRYLDNEATPAERGVLRRTLDQDQAARALYEELSGLDIEVQRALHRVLDRPALHASRAGWFWRTAQTVGLAAAACLMMMLWTWPADPGRFGRSDSSRAPTQGGVFPHSSAPTTQWRPEMLDQPVEVAPELLERPYRGRRHTTRNWILIPGEDPGQVYVVEVNQIQTRAVVIHGDF